MRPFREVNMKTNARIFLLTLFLLLFSSYPLWATVYMTPEELSLLRLQEEIYERLPVVRPPHTPTITDFGEDYNRAALFLKTLQVMEPGPDFGGMREAEHMPDVIQTDNTEEAVWIWSRYFELTGDESVIQNIENAWIYIWNFPSWREEGGNHPSYGYGPMLIPLPITICRIASTTSITLSTSWSRPGQWAVFTSMEWTLGTPTTPSTPSGRPHG